MSAISVISASSTADLKMSAKAIIRDETFPTRVRLSRRSADHPHLPSEISFASASAVASHFLFPRVPDPGERPSPSYLQDLKGSSRARCPLLAFRPSCVSLPRVSGQGERRVAAKASAHYHGRDRTELLSLTLGVWEEIDGQL